MANRKVSIRTVDTYVVVLAISFFNKLVCDGLEDLLVDFASGEHRRVLSVKEMVERIGSGNASGLPIFHAFTGCDQVSFMAHVTKRTAWNTWTAFPDITNVFCTLSDIPTLAQVNASIPAIERFTVLLYQRSSNCMDTNECRQELFCQGKSIDSIPPTSVALMQDTLRAAFIAGHVLSQSTKRMQQLQTPEDWGWRLQEDGRYKPHWSDLPEAAIGDRELIRCSCKPEKGG